MANVSRDYISAREAWGKHSADKAFEGKASGEVTATEREDAILRGNQNAPSNNGIINNIVNRSGE